MPAEIGQRSHRHLAAASADSQRRADFLKRHHVVLLRLAECDPAQIGTEAQIQRIGIQRVRMLSLIRAGVRWTLTRECTSSPFTFAASMK